MVKNSFHKDERLKSRKSIEALFRTGKSVGSPPYRALFRFVESDSPSVKCTVAIPKKLIRQAVNRNLLKRRTREVYRKNKHVLCDIVHHSDRKLELVFLYQSSEILTYKQLQQALIILIKRLEKELSKTF